MYRTWPLGTKEEEEGERGAEAAAAAGEEEGEDVGVGWRGARTVYLPLPYRLDAPMYCEQEEWDETPDLLVHPYFHSCHDFLHHARLRSLEGAVRQVFAEVREDLRELRVNKGGRGGRSSSDGLMASASSSSSSHLEWREGKRAKVEATAKEGE